MKMAKASEADMEMAINLVQAFEALGQRWCPTMPEPIQELRGDSDSEHFDHDDDAQCGRAMRHLLEVANRGSLARVIWGMVVLLDPKNKIVDPKASTLERHPDIVLLPGGLEPIRQLLSDAGAALADLGACNDPECPESACMRVRTRIEAQLRSLGS
jgi:hypothetical protein